MRNDIVVFGSGEINGGDYCEIKAQGSIKVKSNIVFQKIQVFGKLDCNSNLFGDEVCLTGSIEGNSNIKTNRTIISFFSNSTCKEIESNIIKIAPKKHYFLKNRVFFCERISGNDVFVSNVVAKTICGKNICVDGECHIRELKYWGTCTISEQSTVDNIVKLENI